MANIIINTEIQSDLSQILKRFDGLIDDDTTMIEIYNLFGKMIEPWVPMDTGILAHSYEATPKYLRYPGPYAHYQYMGIVYGPNFPIYDENGNIVGWASPPKKYPTDRSLVYSTEKHERASKEWDKAAWEVIKEPFLEAVKAILIRRHKQIYG